MRRPILHPSVLMNIGGDEILLKRIERAMNKVKSNLVTCGICHGMGTTEAPSGDTRDCVACGGKGYK